MISKICKEINFCFLLFREFQDILLYGKTIKFFSKGTYSYITTFHKNSVQWNQSNIQVKCANEKVRQYRNHNQRKNFPFAKLFLSPLYSKQMEKHFESVVGISKANWLRSFRSNTAHRKRSRIPSRKWRHASRSGQS